MHKKIGNFIGEKANSNWFFPVLLTFIFLTVVGLKINGSSIGIYYETFYGSKAKDHSLIFGDPKSIRSDEWNTASSWTVLQDKTGLEEFNKHLGSGRDLSFSPNNPVKSWVELFRPHTMAYFFLPLSYAFAFSWWFGILFLIICSYFLLLRILKNKLWAAALSISIGLSPYILWWYQVSLAYSVGLTFLILIIVIRILENEKIKFVKSEKLTKIIYISTLSYCLISFGLIFYIPYLVPMFLTAAAFSVGHLLSKKKKLSLKYILSKTWPILLSVLIAASVGGFYFIEHSETISAVNNSVYPGKRIVTSGNLPYSVSLPVFGTFLQPLLQNGGKFFGNQSESSSFILLMPYLLIPGIFFQFFIYRKKKKLDWPLATISFICLLFLARVSIPFGDPFYRLLLLDRVPNQRLFLGIGFAGFIYFILLIKLILENRPIIKKYKKYILGYIAFCYVFTTALGFIVKSNFPSFIPNYGVVFALAFAFSTIIAAVLLGRITISIFALLFFTALSSYNIFPIYRGLDVVDNSEIIKKIQEHSAPDDQWVVLDSLKYESLPSYAGRGLINGPQIYTDLDFWREFDTNHQYEYIYNRQAHALFITNTKQPDKTTKNYEISINNDFELPKGNVFKVKFQCSNFTYEHIDFALTDHELNIPCLTLLDKVEYPNVKFYIYKINPSEDLSK